MAKPKKTGTLLPPANASSVGSGGRTAASPSATQPPQKGGGQGPRPPRNTNRPQQTGGAAGGTTQAQAPAQAAATQAVQAAQAAGPTGSTVVTTVIPPPAGQPAGGAATTGASKTPRAKRTQPPPPPVAKTGAGGAGNWFKKNWWWIVLIILLSIMGYYVVKNGGLEKAGYEAMIAQHGTAEVDDIDTFPVPSGTSVVPPPGYTRINTGTKSIIAGMPTTVNVTNGIAVFVVGGGSVGDIVNGENHATHYADRGGSARTPEVTAVTTPRAVAPAPAPIVTPPAPSWPHDGSGPSLTIRTMSECDEGDPAKVGGEVEFILRAHSDVAYRTPYGFDVRFEPSDESRLDKAINIGTTPAPIWRSKAEYMADGGNTPAASFWYKNRGDTDIKIKVSFVRTAPPRVK